MARCSLLPTGLRILLPCFGGLIYGIMLVGADPYQLEFSSSNCSDLFIGCGRLSPLPALPCPWQDGGCSENLSVCPIFAVDSRCPSFRLLRSGSRFSSWGLCRPRNRGGDYPRLRRKRCLHGRLGRRFSYHGGRLPANGRHNHIQRGSTLRRRG